MNATLETIPDYHMTEAEAAMVSAAFAEEIGFGRDWRIISAPWPNAQESHPMLRGLISENEKAKLGRLSSILSSFDDGLAYLNNTIEIPYSRSSKDEEAFHKKFVPIYQLYGDLGDANTMVYGSPYLASLLTVGWSEVAEDMRKARGGFDSIGQRIDAELKLDSIKDESGNVGFHWQSEPADVVGPRAYSALVATAELEHVKLQLRRIFGDNFEIKDVAAPGRRYIATHSSPHSRIHITIPRYRAQEPTPETVELRGGFDTIAKRVEAEFKLADIKDPEGQLYGLQWQREMQTRITNENGQPLISPIYKATTTHSQVKAIEAQLERVFGDQIRISARLC